MSEIGSQPEPEFAAFIGIDWADQKRQLLLSADERVRLHAFLPEWIIGVRALREARRVRWSLDVDPIDLY